METSKFTNENSKMADSQKGSNDNVIKPSVLQSPIIMKVDGPSDDPCKKENEDNKTKDSEQKFNDLPTFKSCNPNNPFTISQNRISRSILKPPQLNVNNGPQPNNKPFILKPSQLNPFAKSESSSSDNKTSTENGDKTSRLTNGEPPKPKFLPLLLDNKKSQASASSTNHQPPPSSTANNVSSSSFVFGQNLKDRVLSNEPESTQPTASTSVSSNGTKESTSEMLFSSAIKSENKSEAVPKEKEVKSLSESAREYEESRTSKRKYEEVEVITGEENENNILKVSCKLFSFDNVSSSWQERGRGTLRLNDLQVDNNIASRIVFRTTGSLRVILNTKIWAEMTVEKASEKSVRITALDANGDIRVFLIMASIEDANKLFAHLQTRLEREIAAQKRKKGTEIETNVSESN